MTNIRGWVIILLLLPLPGCGLRLGFPEATQTASCEGEACGDVSIVAENPGNTVKNASGSRTVVVSIEWLAGFGPCLDASTITLGPGQSQTYLNGGYCVPYKATYAPTGTVVPPRQDPARMSTFTIQPARMSAGNSATFRIVLQSAAPPGGAVVGIAYNTITGVTSTIVNMPYQLTFNPGVKEATISVRTQRVVPDSTRILFTAFTAISRSSAELVVD
jgi:hypothetical protein